MLRHVRLPDTPWLVGAVLLLNLTAVGAHAVLRDRLGRVGLIAVGTQLTYPEGIASDGSLVTADHYRRHPCHVIRYESTRCGYCTLDRPVFEQLARMASERSCSVTLVAPTPDQFFAASPEAASVALAHPSVAAARTLPSYGTPITVITNASWTVSWSKSGALQETDLTPALAGLD